MLMNIHSGNIKETKYKLGNTKFVLNELSQYFPKIVTTCECFNNLSLRPLPFIKVIPIKNESNQYLRSYPLYYSASQLFERSIEYKNNDFNIFSNVISDFKRNISSLKVKISSELEFLREQETKWTSIFDFAEEYKNVFEITDEELWYEFGEELNLIAYEIHNIEQTKQLIDASRIYLEKAERNICILSKRLQSNQGCGFRHQIAFSTKNLDDEHNSEVKIIDNSLFVNSEFVFHEKKDNYRSFAYSLQEGK
jgi:hypothetical protein